MVSIRAECVPSSYRGAVALFASVDYALREWFWAPYLDDLGEIEELPHRHDKVLRPPGVDDLADAVRGSSREGGLALRRLAPPHLEPGDVHVWRMRHTAPALTSFGMSFASCSARTRASRRLRSSSSSEATESRG